VPKVRKPFQYALLGTLLFLSTCFISPETVEYLEDSKIVLYFVERIKLKEISDSTADPILKRVLVENPKVLAQEQIQAGNFIPIAIGIMYSDIIPGMGTPHYIRDTAKKRLVGIECSKDEKLNIDFREDYGCLPPPESETMYEAIENRYKIYNQTLVQSPGYRGSCKLVTSKK
jgi:hypothetical protein